MYDVNIDRILVSNKVPFGKKGFKYFVGYDNDSKKNYALLYNACKNECI